MSTKCCLFFARISITVAASSGVIPRCRYHGTTNHRWGNVKNKNIWKIDKKSWFSVTKCDSLWCRVRPFRLFHHRDNFHIPWIWYNHNSVHFKRVTGNQTFHLKHNTYHNSLLRSCLR
jgi:hypothetical protein